MRETKAAALKDKSALGHKYTGMVKKLIVSSQESILQMAGLLKEVAEKQLWESMGYKSWNAYLADPEICLSPSSVEHYVSLYDYYIGEHKMKLEAVSGVSLNKLQVIKSLSKNPKKWVEQAPGMALRDLKHEIVEQDHKIEMGAPEVDRAIERAMKSCPFFDVKSCACSEGVKIPARVKKADKNDDLI